MGMAAYKAGTSSKTEQEKMVPLFTGTKNQMKHGFKAAMGAGWGR